MSQTSQPGVLPLRPLTVGELLDAAVSLLRTRAGRLLGLGAAAATAEQLVLFPLRRLADVDIWYWPADDRWPAWLLLVAVGFGTEAAIVAGLGRPAATAGLRALLGPAAPRPEPGARPAAATAAVAVVAAAAAGLAVATGAGWPSTFFLLSFATLGLWLGAWGWLGLAVPAVVIDRLGPVAALRRSIGLASRGLLRGARVRVLAYLGWFVIRLAWGLGVLSLVGLFFVPVDTTMDNLLMAAVYLVVNAFAYPALACLDTVLQLEARMRTEGLDIALRRALQRGVEPTGVLVGG